MIRPRRAAGPLLLLVIACGLFWKLAFGRGEFTWLNSPDLSSQVLPWFNFQAREWSQGRFPLWDPYNWGGQSLAGRTEPGVMYPLNWLLFLVPLEGGRVSMTALNWYYILTHYLGALFCYLLCRDLGRSVAASLLAGAAFGMGGYLGSSGWPQMVNSAVWGPLVLLFFLRAMRGQRELRNAALAGAFFGVSLLGGHHQIPTFVMLVVGGLWVYHLAASGWRVRRFAAIAAVFAGMAFAAGAAQLLPSIEYAKLAVRWVGSPHDPLGWSDRVPYVMHTGWALLSVALAGVVLPGLHNITNPYMGFGVAALALLAVLVLWARRDVRLFSGVALGGLLFALGGASVVHGVIYSLVPAVEKARNPSVAVYIFGLGLAVLAAFGLDALAEERERTAPFARKLAMACWISAGVVFVMVLGVYAAQGDRVFTLGRLVSGAVCALLAGGALAYPGRAARGLLVLVVVFELGNVAGYDFLERAQRWDYLDQLDRHADLADYLKLQEGPLRVWVDRADIPYNFGEWYGIEETGGNSGVTANIWRLGGERNARALLGERFTLARKPARPDQTEVFAGSSGVRIFLSPEAFPRAWTVHETIRVGSLAELRSEVQQPVSHLRARAVLLGDAPQLERSCDGSGDEARIVERDHTRTVIQVRMGCRGMLIVADTWFPGWQAELDGRPARIYETYGFLRGVMVEAGDHRVALSYRPGTVRWGAALSGVGLAAAAFLLFWRPKNG